MRATPLVLISSEEQDPFYSQCSRLFYSHGFECAHVPKDGLMVCRFIRELRPVLVLMDVFMPGCDAISVMQTIRSDRTVNPPVFVTLSSFHNETLLNELIKCGSAKVFFRPFQTTDLVERIIAYMRAMRPYLS